MNDKVFTGLVVTGTVVAIGALCYVAYKEDKKLREHKSLKLAESKIDAHIANLKDDYKSEDADTRFKVQEILDYRRKALNRTQSIKEFDQKLASLESFVNALYAYDKDSSDAGLHILTEYKKMQEEIDVALRSEERRHAEMLERRFEEAVKDLNN